MRPVFRRWLLAPMAVLVLVAWTQSVRAWRVAHLTALPEWSVGPPTVARESPTGYASGHRALVVPDRLGQSQQWIAQTQTMLDRGAWRLRQVDYDNAPFGRETHLPALYRGWLGLLAIVHADIAGVPPGLAVERVALYADPLLLLFLGVATAWFVRRQFGAFAATVVAVALLTLYPFATSWLPGAPDPQGLTLACALWSVLPLAAAAWRSTVADGNRRTAPPVIAAGVAGGLGLWLNANLQAPVLAGLVAGALASAWLFRKAAQPQAGDAPMLPWRLWGLAGGATSLLAYSLEYYPDALVPGHPGNHPLHALAWVAAGELLQQIVRWIHRGSRRPSRREALAGGTAFLALAGLVATAVASHAGGFAADLTASRLTRLHDGFTASSLGSWLATEGFSLRVFATLLPAVLLFVAAPALLLRCPSRRPALTLALGPSVVVVAMACFSLREWNTFGAVALVALAVATAGPARPRPQRRWPWAVAVASVAAPGLLLLLPPRALFRAGEFTPGEMQALVERDLAHWLAQRNPAAVVLAPPALTTSLWFYGGVRGIATFDVDNREGFTGGLRIAAASTAHEALALLHRRGVTHLVLPSIDRSFDQAARESATADPNARLPEGVERKAVFIDQLREWILPPWLRPVAAVTPKIGGFTADAAIVLEVDEEQREPVLLARMAVYFVEAGMPGHASALRPFLQRHPTDLGALVALAEIELAREDRNGFAAALAAVVPALDARADRFLPWERRVALAAVLARGGREELARRQTEQCFERARPADVGALSPRSLYRLLALGRHYGVRFADDALQCRAPSLLPPAFAEALQ